MKKPGVPGSAKVGEHDLRSTDLSGPRADDVTPHSERASQGKKPKKNPAASGEVAGALKDQVGRGKA
ncbi:MAG: hypothetical protein K5Q68_22340 [Roseococcus sp.]|nr:hypothetical protein [Roseococcus sp.]